MTIFINKMSADSSKRPGGKSVTAGQIVLPQSVNDPSIIESVADFIHEVVPQAYNTVVAGDVKENTIIWAKFESCDYNDIENYLTDTECESESIPPLLLVLGYASGVQVWSINGSGEAREVLSWSAGVVRCLRLLYSPRQNKLEPLAHKRPLIALVDNSSVGAPFCTLNFISLRTAEVVKSIKFKSAICDVAANRKSIVVTFVEKIAVFDLSTLDDRLTITTCYDPGVSSNPVALGSRWLAYADKKLTTWLRSSGGCEDEGAQSYTATVIHAAKSLGKGLRDLGGSLTGGSPPSSSPHPNAQPGIVTIIDVEAVRDNQNDDNLSSTNDNSIIAHFIAHTGPIVCMSFDPSGMLLIVADKYGHRFNIFRIHPHPCGPALAAVHHLYILHRGDTTARVQDICVSWDSRWIAVSSLRGTTHVFPITPYGGPIAVRTHTTSHVVNRVSRFEQSAGLDGRASPVDTTILAASAIPVGGNSNPRLPPYPHPLKQQALAQLRRPHMPTGGRREGNETPSGLQVRLATTFAAPRAWLPGAGGRSPAPTRSAGHHSTSSAAAVEALFVMASHGSLVQYNLEPRALRNITKDKISYDTGIELGVDAKGEWILATPTIFRTTQPTSGLQPPLSPNNPLMSLANSLLHHSGSNLGSTTTSSTVTTMHFHHQHLNNNLLLSNSQTVNSKQSNVSPSSDLWLSQVEIVTHTGPHRRLWMGPQFTFKSVDQQNIISDLESVEVVGANSSPSKSTPVNIPRRPYLLIESGSGGSIETPYMIEDDEQIRGDSRLKEDLADAMLDAGNHTTTVVVGGVKTTGASTEIEEGPLERCVNQYGSIIAVTEISRQPIEEPTVDTMYVECPTCRAMVCKQTCLETDSMGKILDLRLKMKDDIVIESVKPYYPSVFTNTSVVQSAILSPPDYPLSDKSLTTIKEKVESKKEELVKVKLIKPKDKNGKKWDAEKTKTNINLKSLETTTEQTISEREIIIDNKVEKNLSEETNSQSIEMTPSKIVTTSSTVGPETVKFREFKKVPTSDSENISVEKPLLRDLKDASDKSDQKCIEVETKKEIDVNILKQIEKDLNTITKEKNKKKQTKSISQKLTDSFLKVKKNKKTQENIKSEVEKEIEEKLSLNLKSEISKAEIVEHVQEVIVDDNSKIVEDNKLDETSMITSCNKLIEQSEKMEIKDSVENIVQFIEPVNICSTTKLQEITDETTENVADKEDTKQSSDAVETSFHVDDENIEISEEIHKSITEAVQDIDIVTEFVSNNENVDKQITDILIKEVSTKGNTSNLDNQFPRLNDSGIVRHSEADSSSGSEQKKPRKDRSRKSKSASDDSGMSESRHRDKLKSPSPIKSEGGMESSDEAPNVEIKTSVTKQAKRKKNKRIELESSTTSIVKEEEKILPVNIEKQKPDTASDIDKSDYDTCSEKKSDSSVESFFELKKKLDQTSCNVINPIKSWSSIVRKGKDEENVKKTNQIEDRDSVYESCNDEEFSNNNFKQTDDSSKIDNNIEDDKIDEKQKDSESTSASANEDKTDSGEKDKSNDKVESNKKRKQKKKKR